MNSLSTSSISTFAAAPFAAFFTARRSCFQSFFSAAANRKNEIANGTKFAGNEISIKIDVYCQATANEYPNGLCQSKGVLDFERIESHNGSFTILWSTSFEYQIKRLTTL